MAAKITNLPHPELFIGFVSPIGADVQSCVEEFSRILASLGYNVVDIKITDVFTDIQEFVRPKAKILTLPSRARYESHIKYGNQLCNLFKDNAFLAALTIARIMKVRTSQAQLKSLEFQKTAYLLHQFKRREEIELLRSVYGRLFFQVSVYSRRGARVDHLAHTFANSEDTGNINKYRASAEAIVQIDENENDVHGQKVSKIFHDGDLIVNADIITPNVRDQVKRFCYLLFGHNAISPTKIEYGMFIAKAAALRTLDLSRQVGAAIFSEEGEIISIGSNEVPKAGGGTYWSDEQYDDREYARKIDSNDRRKKEILAEVASLLGKQKEAVLKDKRIADSQFMDALEYGRIIHAEMCAITDAARLGRAVKKSALFTTAFPCHMCAKHIVSSGVQKVIFLEPYPKSLVLDLHNDSIVVESGDRGRYSSYPAASFEHFYGISPRRYREMFERGKRKHENGTFKEWERGSPQPNLDVNDPYYISSEENIFTKEVSAYIRKCQMDDKIFSLSKIVIHPPSTTLLKDVETQEKKPTSNKNVRNRRKTPKAAAGGSAKPKSKTIKTPE